jgi:hypothetical protein
MLNTGNTSFTSSDIHYLKETNRIMKKWLSEVAKLSEAPQLLTILQQENLNLIGKIERGIAYCNEMYKEGQCSKLTYSEGCLIRWKMEDGLTLLNTGNISFTSSDINDSKETNRKMQKWLSEAPPNWIGTLELDDYEDYYQTRIENPELARQKRDSKCTTEDCILREGNEKDNKTRILAEFVLYGNFTFKLTQEAVVSIALLQLPALCLSTFGIMRASGWTDRLLALLIIFVPFCLVEVLALFEFYQANFQSVIDKVKFGVEKGLKFACGIFYEKVTFFLQMMQEKGTDCFVSKLQKFFLEAVFNSASNLSF